MGGRKPTVNRIKYFYVFSVEPFLPETIKKTQLTTVLHWMTCFFINITTDNLGIFFLLQ